MSRIKLTEKDLINLIRSASKGLNEQGQATWTCDNGVCKKVVGKGGVGEFASEQECEDSNCEERARPGGYRGRGDRMSAMDTQALNEAAACGSKLHTSCSMTFAHATNYPGCHEEDANGNCYCKPGKPWPGDGKCGGSGKIKGGDRMSAMDTQALNEAQKPCHGPHDTSSYCTDCCDGAKDFENDFGEGTAGSGCGNGPGVGGCYSNRSKDDRMDYDRRGETDPTIFNPDDPDGQHSVRPMGPGAIKPFSKARGIATESQLKRIIKRAINEIETDDEFNPNPPITPTSGRTDKTKSKSKSRGKTTKSGMKDTIRRKSNNNSNSGSGILPICCYRPDNTIMYQHCNSCPTHRPGFYCANCPPPAS